MLRISESGKSSVLYRQNSYFVIARSRIISDLLGGEGKHDPIKTVALLP